jgi:hypothetical protein
MDVGKVGGVYMLIERPKGDTSRRFAHKKGFIMEKLSTLAFHPQYKTHWKIPISFPTTIPQMISHKNKSKCHRLIKRPTKDTDGTIKQNKGEKNEKSIIKYLI